MFFGTLTGQQIKDTYQGLLKLADSSTGITTTAQAIQDGLGNDTGIQIATNYLAAPNVVGMLNLKNDYYGTGYGSAGSLIGNGTQNLICAMPFYDNGLYSYSAMTYFINSATTSSDVFDVAFYTSQMVDNVGLAPYQEILSAQTLTVNSTGLKTTTFSSNLSFSGYGAGFYWIVWKTSNASVNPTFRVRQIPDSTMVILTQMKLGFQKNSDNSFARPFIAVGSTNNSILYSGLSSFQSSYSTTDVATYSTSVAPNTIGFALHTIK